MQFYFDKTCCQNTRRALRHEWLLTNGLGDYSSSSILCCNTRKYHGLFVKATQQGRCVLLSAVEESLCGEGREFSFSTRQHPLTMYPNGFDFQESFIENSWPVFRYRMGNTIITRELILLQKKSRLLIRWTLDGNGILPQSMRVRPLLAFRNFHELTHENGAINTYCTPMEGGFHITPYNGLPTLHFQTGADYTWTSQADWCRNVEYQLENERGFPYAEDLFIPGYLDIAIKGLGSSYLVVGTEPFTGNAEQVWHEETRARATDLHSEQNDLSVQLKKAGEQFLVEDPSGRSLVVAGYPWFGAWGRDTLIALPGLTFYAGKTDQGLKILSQIGKSIRNGLVPNMFGEDGNDAYNSVDASLWYAFAVQCYLDRNPDGLPWVREHAWPALQIIVQGFRNDPGFGIYIDSECLLHAGNSETQLTWMDAQANGHPVTPRHGCAVELNALWYNTLEFYQHLATTFRDGNIHEQGRLATMRKNFIKNFYTAKGGGYLGDVWRDGWLDTSIRPNQIFAVSLPYSIVPDSYHARIVACVQKNLLTPYGLRTLAPNDPNFKSRYEGGPNERDLSYHQGTVWPWLLGHFLDALLKSTWDPEQQIQSFLETLTPLFSDHLLQAGVGTISEIFDAAPPYRPNGCFAQAWSVAECTRLLANVRAKAPGVYANWEGKLIKHLKTPLDDTVGKGRIL